MEIFPPIIIFDSDDLYVFSSINEAEAFIEPYDINCISGFDSHGLFLEFQVVEEYRKVLGIETPIKKILITPNPTGHSNEFVLKEQIENYFNRIKQMKKSSNYQKEWQEYSLSELINFAKRLL